MTTEWEWELTVNIEQALQKGIAAHKEGKVQDAERLYRVILKSQPLHPEANHNLGLLAASSVNQADAALQRCSYSKLLLKPIQK